MSALNAAQLPLLDGGGDVAKETDKQCQDTQADEKFKELPKLIGIKEHKEIDEHVVSRFFLLIFLSRNFMPKISLRIRIH